MADVVKGMSTDEILGLLGPDQPGLLEQIRDEFVKTGKAVGFVTGLYKAKSEQEAQELRKRAIAEGVFTAVSTLGTGGTALALRGATPFVRVALSSMLGGAAGGAAAAPVEGGSPLMGGLAGGIGGGLLSLPGAALAGRAAGRAAASTAERTALEAAEAAARPLQEAEAGIARFAQMGAPPGAQAATQGLEGLIPGERNLGQELADIGFPEQQAFRPMPTYAATEGEIDQLARAAYGEVRRRADDALREAEGGVQRLGAMGQPPPPSYQPQGLEGLMRGERIQEPGFQQAPRFIPNPVEQEQLAAVAQNRANQLAMEETQRIENLGNQQFRASQQFADEPVQGFERVVQPGGPTELRTPPSEDLLDWYKLANTPQGVPQRIMGLEPTAAPQEFTRMLSQEPIEGAFRFSKLPRDEALKIYYDFISKGGKPQARVLRRSRPPTRMERYGAPKQIEIANTVSDDITTRLGPDVKTAVRGFNDLRKLWDRAVTAGSDLLKKTPSGRALSTAIQAAHENWQLRAGRDIVRVMKLGEGLTPGEKTTVSAIMEGAPSTNTKLIGVANQLRDLLDEYAGDAEKLGLRMMTPDGQHKTAFRRLRNFYPHIFSERTRKELLNPGPKQESALAEIMKNNTEMSRKEAKALLARLVNAPSEIRNGNLQMSRTAWLPGYEKDFTKALPNYIMRGSRRLETARQFGPSDRIAWKLVQGITDEGGDGIAAQQILDAFIDPKLREFSGLAKLTGSFNVLTMLSTAGLVQPAQLINTASRTGYLNLLKGIAGLMTKEGKQWAEGSGAAVRDLVQDIGREGEGVAGKWVKIIGLDLGDRMNRLTSALAGREYAKEIAQKLIARPTDKRLLHQAAKLGFTPEQALAQGGRLTDDQLRTAALRVANDTQFAGSVLDLPAMRNTPQGQFMYLFKSFGMQQGRFVKQMVKDAKNGDVGPLLRYTAGLGTFGAGIGEAVRLARGREAPDEPLWRWIEDMTFVGSIGVAGDAVRAMQHGPEAVAGFMGGPAVGETLRLLGRDVPAGWSGDPEPMMRHVIQRVPLAGPRLAEWLVP